MIEQTFRTIHILHIRPLGQYTYYISHYRPTPNYTPHSVHYQNARNCFSFTVDQHHTSPCPWLPAWRYKVDRFHKHSTWLMLWTACITIEQHSRRVVPLSRTRRQPYSALCKIWHDITSDGYFRDLWDMGDHSEMHEEGDRTMVTAVDITSNHIVTQTVLEAVGDDKVVQAPETETLKRSFNLMCWVLSCLLIQKKMTDFYILEQTV